MSIVKREDIPLLHSTDPAYFARWLIGGLETLHTTGRGFAGFHGARAFVGATADTSDDLRDIHDCLNPDERAAFRAGVARALGSTVHLLVNPVNPAVIGICNTLLVLAQRLEADEMLDVLPGFASYVFGLSRTDDIDEMMDRVLRTASEVVTPDLRAAKCLRTIIGLARFRSPLAYPALIALCKVEPDKLGDHLRQLYCDLDESFGYVEDRAELARRHAERRDLIAEVFDIVPYDEFFRSSSGGLGPSQQVDTPVNWMVFADWWRNDSFLIPKIRAKYAELRSQGRFSLVDGDGDAESTLPHDPELTIVAGESLRDRMSHLASAAEEAMPGINRLPASIEEAEDDLAMEAA